MEPSSPSPQGVPVSPKRRSLNVLLNEFRALVVEILERVPNGALELFRILSDVAFHASPTTPTRLAPTAQAGMAATPSARVDRLLFDASPSYSILGSPVSQNSPYSTAWGYDDDDDKFSQPDYPYRS